jgi:hypothetical protein
MPPGKITKAKATQTVDQRLLINRERISEEAKSAATDIKNAEYEYEVPAAATNLINAG